MHGQDLIDFVRARHSAAPFSTLTLLMASLDSLPPDQRAVLQLVLQRGRSYDEIAQMLSIDRAAVRERALNAFDGLGPSTRVPAERRALITDYLLGQLPEKVADDTHRGLAESANERAWARVVASELGTLAAGPLPEIPTDGAGARRPRPSRRGRAQPAPNPGPSRRGRSPQQQNRLSHRRGRTDREPDPVAAEPAAAEPQPTAAEPASAEPASAESGGRSIRCREHPESGRRRLGRRGSADGAARRGPAIRSHGGTARSCSAAGRW